MAKAKTAADARRPTDIPNIGPAMARDFTLLGRDHPSGLVGKDPPRLYSDLCAITKTRQEPCVADNTLMAVADFMEGGHPKPWWTFTEKRKAPLGGVHD